MADETVDHGLEADRCEKEAESMLRHGGGQPAGDSRGGIDYGVTANAWATLALSHRTAEQTVKLAERLDTLDGTLGVGFSGMS